ncbi:MAG: hypothetical protein WD016_12025 [Balneolaceae bacterium]
MNEEIIQNLNERLDKAILKGRELINDEDLQVKLEELKDRAEDTIRKNPIGSVLAGLVAGFIIARIFNSED